MSRSVLRRSTAEVELGENPSGLSMIGNRPIHHSWHLFPAQFLNVLLAPQRRPDGSGVSWTWRESVDDQPLSAAELAGLREKLEVGNRAAAEHFGAVTDPTKSSVGRSPPDANQQVREALDGMVTKLIRKRDSALAGFVCRTETGLMLHSWGAPQPARPFF